MPQLNITNPTFSRILQDFQPTGGRLERSDAHVRFSNGKGLYTSQKASLSALKDKLPFFASAHLQRRAAKQDAGATAIKQAIDRQYNTLGLGDQIFRKIAAQHHVHLDHGVRRSDLALIRDTLNEAMTLRNALANVADATPRALQLSSDVNDPMKVTGDAGGTFNNTIQQSFKQDFDKRLNGATIQHTAGKPDVAGQFMSDINRSDITLESPRSDGGTAKELLKPKNPEDPRVALQRFAGSDSACANLSKFLNQSPFNSMHGGLGEALAGPDGRPLIVMVSPPPTKEGEEEAEKNQKINVRESNGVFTIDYDFKSPLNRITNGLKYLVADDSNSEVRMKAQIQISRADLEAGRLDRYQVTQQPSYDVHFELDAGATLDDYRPED